jgi:hypothetical protein
MRVDGVPVAIVEEMGAEETAVAGASLRVEDPELRPPPRRSGPLLLDDDLRPLAHDLAAEPDPRPAPEPEPQPRRLRERPGDPLRDVGGLQDDEEGTRPAGMGGEAEQALREAIPGGDRPVGEVQEEDVHRPRAQQLGAQVHPIRDPARHAHDELVQDDAARRRLHGVE